MFDFLRSTAWRAGLSGGLALASLTAHALTDPTKPVEAEVEIGMVIAVELPAEAPQLEAILRSAKERRAVINGQSLRVGESLGDLNLLEIRSRSVVIEVRGKRSELFISTAISPKRHHPQ